MNIDELQLTLENEANFHREYTAIKNIPTSERSGRSASVARRKLIGDFSMSLGPGRLGMIETIKLEKYFNERWDLCAYGLEEPTPGPKKPKAKPKPELQPVGEEGMKSTTANSAFMLLTNRPTFCERYITARDKDTDQGGILNRVYLIHDTLINLGLSLEYGHDEWMVGMIDKELSKYKQLQPLKETTMGAPNTISSEKSVEVVTYVFGRKSSDVSDNEIFTGIAHLESEIHKLEGIVAKPAKLLKRIEELRAEIQTLCDVVDAR